MNNQDPLEIIVTTLNVIGTIERINFYCESEKYHDDYYLKIKIVKEDSNNQAMAVFKEEIATLRLKIRIDSHKLFEAYKLLNEEEKIPKHLNIINPCVVDNYMNSLVELRYLEIINNLKAFNGKSDNYDTIARLAGKCYGYHIGKGYGI